MKVLRLREKWDLHRNIQVTLEMIEIRRACGLIDTQKAVDEIGHVAQTYGQHLSELNSPGDVPGSPDGPVAHGRG